MYIDINTGRIPYRPENFGNSRAGQTDSEKRRNGYMWSIGEVKRRGWRQIGLYYWPAFLLLLIFSLASGLGEVFRVDIDSLIEGIMEGGAFYGIWDMAAGLLLSFVAISGLVGLLVRIFVLNPMEVGVYRFFMESRAEGFSVGVSRILYAFSSGSYGNIVKIMFFRDLFLFLWTLLLIIPGIVKSFEYRMIPYILSENPDADMRDVFALTKDMMRGSKFQLFLFDLSFLGWYLLGILACGIGLFFVAPYVSAAEAEVYAELRNSVSGFPLRGFGERNTDSSGETENEGWGGYENQE
ncbi:hypothetical protein CLOM621_07675 [Clostridium sp. M62/1]|nr:hypothetical protein CLOM621_07675 [Clostridium sp. M62/1]